MCGIAGEVAATGREPDVDAVARMADTLAPRGPDGSGAWQLGRVALGHRRLKIIDLTDDARQPMVDDELGLTVVFNGCIYNYQDLREELARAGHRFFSHGDTEVILKGCHEWGEGLLERLQGMFAFAIAEHRDGEVVLVRDRLGIKPLYLHETDGPAAVRLDAARAARGGRRSTRHRPGRAAPLPDVPLGGAGAAHDPERRPTPGARHDPPSRAPTARVTSAASGTCDFDGPAPRADLGADEWRDAVLDALRLAVRRRLVADVPVGVPAVGRARLQSSSSACWPRPASAACRPSASASSPTARSRATSSGTPTWSPGEFDTDHHQIRIPSADLPAALADAIGAMSEPMVSHDVVAFHLLSAGGREARQGRAVRPGRRRGVRRLPLVPAAR